MDKTTVREFKALAATRRPLRWQLRQVSGMAAAVAAVWHGLPATAQTAAASATAPQSVVVTGSRIRSLDATSISPVTSLGAIEFAQRGVLRVEDLLNTLPQAYADQSGGGNRSGTVGASGTATVNLRNLGNQRTLVLIDGRRLMQGDPARSTAQAPDINNIPPSLIERVDIVTGGASAVYGSDALAGVVNFVMKRNFEGLRLDAQASAFQHDNNNPIGAVGVAAGQPVPAGRTWGGWAAGAVGHLRAQLRQRAWQRDCVPGLPAACRSWNLRTRLHDLQPQRHSCRLRLCAVQHHLPRSVSADQPDHRRGVRHGGAGPDHGQHLPHLPPVGRLQQRHHLRPAGAHQAHQRQRVWQLPINTGINALSRLPQTRSPASHSMTRACRTASS